MSLAALASQLRTTNKVLWAYYRTTHCLRFFWAALASLLRHSLALQIPSMSFLRVSRLQLASPPMLLASFGLSPAPSKPVYVFSLGFKTAVCQPSNASRRLAKPVHGLGFQTAVWQPQTFSAAWASLLHLANPFMSFFTVSRLPFASLHMLPGALPSPFMAFLRVSRLPFASRQILPGALQSPFMAFVRVSRLPFASRQMLLGSFGITPAPCLPLHVFS